AAPDGARRPCSHSCSVRTETPSSAENWDCDKPVRSRISEIAGSVVIRPWSPRFSSASPSRISCPMLRLVEAIDLLLDSLQYRASNRRGLVLGVHRQHPDLAAPQAEVVDDADAATLSASGQAPAQLADTA